MEDMFRVGVITTTHGVRGEVKVFPTTDDLKRFDYLKEAILLTNKKQRIPVEVEGVKYFKNQAILKLKGFDTIETVTPLRQAEIYVTRENAIPLEEGEYYIADLIGLKVMSEEGQVLGILSDVLQTGANDVYSVETPDQKELLLPAIPSCIRKIDLQQGVCLVHVLPGLLEL